MFEHLFTYLERCGARAFVREDDGRLAPLVQPRAEEDPARRLECLDGLDRGLGRGGAFGRGILR